VKFGGPHSQTEEIYDNHDVFNLDNLYWEINQNNEEISTTPIIPIKKVFLRNVNNKRRRNFR